MKRFWILFLALFSFFFMKNNTFAESVTCKYNLINVFRRPVQFNSSGVSLASGDSRSNSDTDNNLIITINDSGSGTNKDKISLSVDKTPRK